MDLAELRAFAEGAGADVFGVANVERFDELPPELHPRTIFPETRSVIVLGRRITRGTLRGVEEGTNFSDYRLYGYDWLNDRFVAMTTFQISEFLEDNGWEAVPLPNLPVEVPPMGVSVRKDQPPPNVMLDFDDAAVRAGLGEIGYCGVLLTPGFGPRQRIQMILTDARIEPTPVSEETFDLPSDRYENVCPLGAFVGERELTICGKKMTVAKIDYDKCASCKNGAMTNRHHPAGKPDRLAAVCIRTCVDLLEKSGRLTNQFRSAFRKREQWVVKQDTDFYKP